MIAENGQKTKSILSSTIYFAKLVLYTFTMAWDDYNDSTGQQEDIQQLLTRLQKVFKDGYRPVRKTESYSVTISNYTKAFNVVNCLGHVFNLTNQQLEDYHIVPYRMFGCFPKLNKKSNFQTKHDLFDFIQETGLKIEECAPDKTITDFKSWKTALYFESDGRYKDFHFLLEDAPQIWSSKVGYTSYFEHLYEKVPPEQYHPLIDNKYVYDFFGTYQITNPNADENNFYVKDAIRNTPPISQLSKKKHCLIGGSREDNYINSSEPILLL